MAGTVVKVDGAEVAVGDAKGTVVNITLRQDSGLAFLCKGAAALLLRRRQETAKGAAGGAPDHPRPRGGRQDVLGGALILLGAVCIGLGAIFSLSPNPVYTDYYYSYYYYEYNRAFCNGVPFWMGGLFVLSGTVSAVGARHGGPWVHFATFLNLGSVVAGSVAFTLGLTDIPSLTDPPRFVERLCQRDGGEPRSYGPWEPTTSPPDDDPKDQDRARLCQAVLWAVVRMWRSTQILLLILHSVALAVALVCFGYGLRRFCRSCWAGWKDYMAVEEADAPLVPEEPNPA